MNKTLIAMAVAGVLAAPLAQADATVYGKMHLSVGQVSDETGATTTTDAIMVRSSASRLGFKGSADLTGGLKAIYKLEYGVNPDSDGTNGSGLSRRNQYMGLNGGFGTALIGRHDTPTKMAQGKFDEFNDTDADIKGVIGISRAELRLDNILAYVTPDMGGFDAAIALIPFEGDGDTNGGNGIADSISVMGKYKMGGLFLSLGYDMYDDTTGGAADALGFKSLMRGVVTYKMKSFQVGGLYESSSKTSDTIGSDKDVMGVSGHYTIGGVHKLKLQYMMGTETDGIAAGTDLEETQVSVGYDYKLGDKTTAYVIYTDASEDATVADTRDYSFMGLGMIHNF